MASHRIVCTEQDPPDEPHDQAHIVAVGIGDDPDSADERLTLEEVYEALDSGDTFYTQSKSTGAKANVDKYSCSSCGQSTLRSDADETEENNLNNLRRCSWKNR